MTDANSTCWTMIRDAAEGRHPARDAFALKYAPVIRAYLAARWRSPTLRQEIDDALQEVFIECYREGGVLQRAAPDRPGGFRAFLYGVLRNVALRAETRRARKKDHPIAANDDNFDPPADDATLSHVFDQSWAKNVMREAAQRQSEAAQAAGPDALQRVEILRLRFQENLPIRDIALRFNQDPVQTHRAYARARKEFQIALRDVMTFYHPDSPQSAEKECARLLELLG